MKNLLNKELRLTANPLSLIFIAFSLMAFIPGYPILLAALFIGLGIFQSFQSARENNDILYTALLPVKKSDAVKAKFVFACFIELAGFALMLVFTLIRMTLLKASVVYLQNPLMNANQYFLAWILVIFGLFNIVFIRYFFKTAYKFAKGFIAFLVVAFVAIGIAETLHHIPGLTFLNACDTLASPIHWVILVIGALAYVILTLAAFSRSKALFDKVDL